jgi:hypothetical protein
VLLFVANPYSYDAIYKENQGLVILPKNRTVYYCKKKIKKDTKRGKQKPYIEEGQTVQYPNEKEQKDE